MPQIIQNLELLMGTKLNKIRGKSGALWAESVKSFKDALMETRGDSKAFGKGIDIDSDLETEEGSQSSKIWYTTEITNINGIPRVVLPDKLLYKIRRPWKNVQIFKLLGKNIGYNLLCSKAKNIWGMVDHFTPIDLEYNYLFRFDFMEDCQKVFARGPWVIMDHYLTLENGNHISS